MGKVFDNVIKVFAIYIRRHAKVCQIVFKRFAFNVVALLFYKVVAKTILDSLKLTWVVNYPGGVVC